MIEQDEGLQAQSRLEVFRNPLIDEESFNREGNAGLGLGISFTNFGKYIRERRLLPLATAYAISAFGIFAEPRELRAAEIMPDMSWSQGIEALHHDALTAKNEAGATYVRFKDGSGKWASISQGEATEQDTSLREQVKEIKSELRSGQIERICQFHTHPVFAGEKVRLITEEQRKIAEEQGENASISFPPSEGDISLWSVGQIRSFYKGNEFNAQKYYIRAVIDPAGVWYYRPVTYEDVKKYPDLVAEKKERRDIAYKWRDYVNTRIQGLSDIEITELVRRVKDSRYNEAAGSGMSLKREELREIAKSDITLALMDNEEQISKSFFTTDESNLLQDQWVNIVKKGSERDAQMYAEAYTDYISASLKGEIKEDIYSKLQQAFVRSGAAVRYVRYNKLNNEPPCSGVDMKEKASRE
jgi:hypothetical protein